MARKNSVKQEDLEHLLASAIADEGYDVDSTTEREIARLAKFVINRDEDADEFEDSPELEEEEELFDSYGDEDGDPFGPESDE